jgi:hypothetical protein
MKSRGQAEILMRVGLDSFRTIDSGDKNVV